MDAWAVAPAAHKEVAFHAAFAVRQVEIGLASTLSLVFGTIAGVVMAHTRFSWLAMAINMPANALLLAWMVTLGVCMWRRGGMLPEGPTV